MSREPKKKKKKKERLRRSQISSLLGVARSPAVTADDLDFVGLDRTRILKFEVDILDEKRPYFVTEAISVKMTLCKGGAVSSVLLHVCNSIWKP